MTSLLLAISSGLKYGHLSLEHADLLTKLCSKLGGVVSGQGSGQAVRGS